MAEEKPQLPKDVIGRLKLFFDGLSLQQRLWLGGGVVLVAGTLWAFVTLLGQPKYVTLYSGLKPQEAQTLSAKLAAKNVAYQISPDGSSLLVPEDKLDAARLETAAGGLPRSARLGFELFDTPNWAGSDFTEKVNYQRALEGELERTLATLSEVEAVRVHLVLPQESLFTEQEHEAKAAVILKTRSGRLSEQAQKAIPQLVASAVDRLKPENVTVVDADTNTPLLRGLESGKSYAPDEDLAKTLLHTLEPVVGADHVRASVHVEYDMGTSEDTQETYDPKATATLTQEHSEESAVGASPAGVPGTASNVPTGTPPAAAGAGAEQSNSKSEATTYAVSKSLHRSVEPAGRIRRIAAAVLVDDAVEWTEQAGKRISTRRKRTADELKEIDQLARAAIGVDEKRGDVLAVENLSFQQEPVEAPPVPTKVEHWKRLLEPWKWTLRYLGLAALFAVIYFLILQPVKKQALASFREVSKKILDSMAAEAKVTEGAGPGKEIEGSPDRARTDHLKRLLTEKVKAEPATASRLVESWVREDGE